MKLKITADYRNDREGWVYRKGETIEVDEAVGAYLLADSPGSFEEYKAREKPPEDKAVKGPSAKK